MYNKIPCPYYYFNHINQYLWQYIIAVHILDGHYKNKNEYHKKETIKNIPHQIILKWPIHRLLWPIHRLLWPIHRLLWPVHSVAGAVGGVAVGHIELNDQFAAPIFSNLFHVSVL